MSEIIDFFHEDGLRETSSWAKAHLVGGIGKYEAFFRSKAMIFQGDFEENPNLRTLNVRPTISLPTKIQIRIQFRLNNANQF